MSPNKWGPPVWTFFHTLAEKIKEDNFNNIFPSLFSFIQRICRVLPCPECSQHATQFLSKVNPNGIKNKSDFKNLLHFFHNTVNKRKNKSVFDINEVSLKYSNNNIMITYINFVNVFNTRGNMKLLADTFQRKLVLNDFRKWLQVNLKSFV
jgi:hypothetical protein